MVPVKRSNMSSLSRRVRKAANSRLSASSYLLVYLPVGNNSAPANKISVTWEFLLISRANSGLVKNGQK